MKYEILEGGESEMMRRFWRWLWQQQPSAYERLDYAALQQRIDVLERELDIFQPYRPSREERLAAIARKIHALEAEGRQLQVFSEFSDAEIGDEVRYLRQRQAWRERILADEMAQILMRGPDA